MAAPAMVMIIAFMHVSVAEGTMWAHGKIKIDATPQDICTRAGCTKEKAVSGSVWAG